MPWFPFHCDVTKEADVEALIAEAMKEFGRVDAVLNVAGIGKPAPRRRHHGGVRPDVGCRPSGRPARNQVWHPGDARDGGGVILNWSSIGGLNVASGTGVYAAAKAGVIAITKAAAVEYGPKGIRANAICPGLILTEIMGARPAITFRRCSRRLRSGAPESPWKSQRWRRSSPRTGLRTSRARSSRRRWLVGPTRLTRVPLARRLRCTPVLKS